MCCCILCYGCMFILVVFQPCLFLCSRVLGSWLNVLICCCNSMSQQSNSAMSFWLSQYLPVITSASAGLHCTVFYLFIESFFWGYKDSALGAENDDWCGRTFATSPWSECTSCYQKGRVGSKALLQQNPAVLTWGTSYCRAGYPVYCFCRGICSVLYS